MEPYNSGHIPEDIHLPAVNHCETSGQKTASALPENSERDERRILYTVNENPPWHSCLLLGLQHFLMMVESTVSIPYLVTPYLCMASIDPARGEMASTIIFVSGIVTLLQTTFGVRLPIIQGGTHGFLGPILAMLSLMPACPPEEDLQNMAEDEAEGLWQSRIREVQGGICVAAIFQIVVGFTGLVGILMKWITPLVIAPTVTLIGLSLCSVAVNKAASNWWISGLTVFLLVLFSQYMGDVNVPYLRLTSDRKVKKSSLKLFKLFPVILTVVFSWLMCLILTVTDVLNAKDHARTDLRVEMLYEAEWFRLPYPGQWGIPVVTAAGVLGILAGVIASIIESIGDYYACARLCAAPPPPIHALNRGIYMEGIGTVLAGLFGTGSGTTSYSQNVGAIGVTGVGSRRVVQYAGGIMVACGLIGKTGALFINIPEPIIGGIFIVVFSMITSVGLSSLQYVDLNSSRNLFIIGFSIFCGLCVPMWMSREENAEVIQTGLPLLDQIIGVLLRTSMFVGGSLGFILDNTVPGTPEERGLVAWQAGLKISDLEDNVKADKILTEAQEEDPFYGIPFVSKAIRRSKALRYLPISPTFQGWSHLRKRKVSPLPEHNHVDWNTKL